MLGHTKGDIHSSLQNLITDMKKGLNEVNQTIENEIESRNENEADILGSFKEVGHKVKAQIADERMKRELFEENIFKLLGETTKQLSLIN
jgi:hypothetical protein